MSAGLEILLALFFSALLLWLGRWVYRRCSLPPRQPVFLTVPLWGAAEGLEHTLQALSAHPELPILLVDTGLTDLGWARVELLLRSDPTLFLCTAEEVTKILQRKDHHGTCAH